MKSGFVSIFGRPNAGKSTLVNALVGEKLAIVSHKSQTTRHRIRAFLNGPDHQIIFSDTPGIIQPEYKLHEKMMQAVKSSLEDADVALLLVDVRRPTEESDAIFSALRLKVPAIVVVNKTDMAKPEQVSAVTDFFSQRPYAKRVIPASALRGNNLDQILSAILELLPEAQALIARSATRSSEAYELYLHGRHYSSRRGEEYFAKALEFYSRAIEKDPRYALAYSGIADAYSLIGYYGGLPPTLRGLGWRYGSYRQPTAMLSNSSKWATINT